MSTFALSQLLVGLAFVLSLVSFQFSDQRLIRGILSMCTFALAVHFWILDLHTAAIAAWIASLRFFIAIFWRNKRLLYFFLTLVLLNAVLSYAGILSILATVGTSLATWAAFRHSDREFRLFMMAASAVMITHNLLAFTPAAVALEGFFLCSNLLAYRRFYSAGARRDS